MKRIISILAMMAALSACQQYDITEVLLSRNDISLTRRSVEEFVYTPEKCQMGYNSQKNLFYVCEDKLSNWFSISFEAEPSAEGQTVTADISWTTKTSTQSFQDLSFKVEKVDADGKVWLWNTTQLIGIVIKKL